MNYTQNYKLNQWEASDRVLRSDFNADNAKIDAAIKALEGSKGNCRIEWGSYVGNASRSRTLNFSFSPKLVIIGQSTFTVALRGSGTFVTTGSISYAGQLVWGEKSLTWTYELGTGISSPATFFDGAGETYFWVALG